MFHYLSDTQTPTSAQPVMEVPYSPLLPLLQKRADRD